MELTSLRYRNRLFAELCIMLVRSKRITRTSVFFPYFVFLQIGHNVEGALYIGDGHGLTLRTVFTQGACFHSEIL